MYDVIVVGAGPSGLNAARILTARGLDVLVLERKDEVGKHIICAGIVGEEAFQSFDLSRESVLREIKEIKIVSPYSTVIDYEHPVPFAYAVDRERFDRFLIRGWSGDDIEVEKNSSVEDIVVGEDEVEVRTAVNGKPPQKLRARMVLIATGVNYALHKRLGLGYPRDFLNGVQAEVNLGPVECTHVFLGKDIAAGAFAWLVPIGEDSVRIGLITEKDPGECFRRLIERHFPSRLESLNRMRIQFKPIAQGLTTKTYGHRVLSLGEAAGQVKTTTGGGIYFGLLCSEIAAQVIQKSFEEGCFSAKRLSEYEVLWRRVLQREIRMGYYARKLCARLSDRQIEKVFQIIKSDGFIPLIRERGHFDWHSDLLFMLLRRIPVWNLLKGGHNQDNHWIQQK